MVTSRRMLLLGLAILVAVPVFKTVTDLPPFMGVLFGLGILFDTGADWAAALSELLIPYHENQLLHRLEENIEAASVELPPDELREIESAPSKIKVQGARYPEHLEQITGR